MMLVSRFDGGRPQECRVAHRPRLPQPLHKPCHTWGGGGTPNPLGELTYVTISLRLCSAEVSPTHFNNLFVTIL